MNTHTKSHAAWIFIAVLVVLFQITVPRSFAQGDPCDPDVMRLRGSGGLAYKNLGARCEGTFASLSGGTADLQLVSLTKSFSLMNFKDTPTLSLSWLAPPPVDVRLRAVSTRYKFYYQMDAHPGAADTFAWPTDRLVASRLLRPEVGLLASTPHTVAGETQEILLPVVVQSKGYEPSAQLIEIVLVPTVQLKEVFRTITQYTDAGVKEAMLLSNRPLQYGSYQAHERIVLSLDLRNASGLFRFDVMATVSEGGTIKRSYWIYVGRTP
jgi:hypothetical protein